MRSIATPRVHHAFVFLGSVLLGLWLRSGPAVAHARTIEVCGLFADAELVEVRRIEGTGDIAEQEASWHAELRLTLPENYLSLRQPVLQDPMLPYQWNPLEEVP
jgi:hypothetical protein